MAKEKIGSGAQVPRPAGKGSGEVPQPLPWRLRYDEPYEWEKKRAPYLQDVADANGGRIVLPAIIITTAREGVPLANAKLIVTAVNSFHEMKEALEEILACQSAYEGLKRTGVASALLLGHERDLATRSKAAFSKARAALAATEGK